MSEEFDNIDWCNQQDPTWWSVSDEYFNGKLPNNYSKYNNLRYELFQRISWLQGICFDNPYDKHDKVNEILEQVTELRFLFKEESTEKYINLLNRMKNHIDHMIDFEKRSKSLYKCKKNELVAYNLTLIFATTRLITWANRAKRKVEREYSPTKKRGRQCIEEYENEFHNDDLKNKMTTISQSK